MNIANITSRFALVSGLDKSETYKWHALIDDACNYVGAHIKKQSLDKVDEERAEMLCALYAFRLYCLCNDDNISSFTAGDVSITSPDGGTQRADRLWQEYTEKSTDLIDDNNFLFGRVIM